MFKVLAGAVIGVGLAMLGAALKDGDLSYWIASSVCLAALLPVAYGVWWEERARDPVRQSVRFLRARGYANLFVGAVQFLSEHAAQGGVPLLALNLVPRMQQDTDWVTSGLNEFVASGLLLRTRHQYPGGNPYIEITASLKGQEAYMLLREKVTPTA